MWGPSCAQWQMSWACDASGVCVRPRNKQHVGNDCSVIDLGTDWDSGHSDAETQYGHSWVASPTLEPGFRTILGRATMIQSVTGSSLQSCCPPYLLPWFCGETKASKHFKRHSKWTNLATQGDHRTSNCPKWKQSPSLHICLSLFQGCL